jgi:FHS family L-fucose permease-like MFS transporter
VGVRSLSSNKPYRNAVLTQFFYVGGQITVWSFTIRYVMNALQLDEAEAANYYLASLALFLVARLLFTYLMTFYKAIFLLKWAAIKAVLLLSIVIFGEGDLSVWALVGVSGCMSLMFPTIYGLGMESVHTNTKLASSGFVMAIVGGAVMTGLQGQLSDITGSVGSSFLVPLVCFGAVIYYTLTKEKK